MVSAPRDAPAASIRDYFSVTVKSAEAMRSCSLGMVDGAFVDQTHVIARRSFAW